jgi:methylthioribose-1-phosphate isomerase
VVLKFRLKNEAKAKFSARGESSHSKFKIQNSKLAHQDYVRVANPMSGARNPGFDVTPAELITGIITPSGIYKPQNFGSSETNWDLKIKLNLRHKAPLKPR